MRTALAALGAVVLLAVTSRPLPTQGAQGLVYRGTVRSVRPGVALDLTIGVGEALRLVPIRLTATTRVVAEGRMLKAVDLQPGDIVRAACRRDASGVVADSIERVGRQGAPGVAPP